MRSVVLAHSYVDALRSMYTVKISDEVEADVLTIASGYKDNSSPENVYSDGELVSPDNETLFKIMTPWTTFVPLGLMPCLFTVLWCVSSCVFTF